LKSGKLSCALTAATSENTAASWDTVLGRGVSLAVLLCIGLICKTLRNAGAGKNGTTDTEP